MQRQLRSPTSDRNAELQPLFNRSYERQVARLQSLVKPCWIEGDDPPSFGEPLDQYVAALFSARTKLRAALSDQTLIRDGRPLRNHPRSLDSIVASYVHMTNNRLGLSVPEEAHIAHLVERALNQSAQPREVV